MISLRDLSFRYSGQSEPVIRELSAEFSSDGITAVVGRSGVGKSTLLALLAGIFIEDDGIVGQMSGVVAIDGLPPAMLRGTDVVGWVPQEPTLFDHLNVRQNILLPAKLMGLAGEEAQGRCDALLEHLDLTTSALLRPRELSVGTQTRVSLARALVAKPRYLFLDEPFSALDLVSRWRLYATLANERLSGPLVTIATTHNIPESMAFSDRVVWLRGAPLELAVVYDNPNPPMRRLGAKEALREARERSLTLETEFFATAADPLTCRT